MEKTREARALVRCPFCGQLNGVDMTRAQNRPACGECGKPLLLDRPVHVTDQDLERVVQESTVPVVVDFYADWCQPCKYMAPLLDELARERMGQVLVTKLDTDRNPTMAVRFGIQGIPTLIVFREGREYQRQVGALPRARLDALIDEVVAAGDA